MPLVLATRRRRMNLGCKVKLAGVLLATALTLTGCAPKWSSDRIPTYEPLPVDISGFPNAADKAKLAEIASYMRERLVARHVDAPHANAILWQFHFFAPVRYFDDDCSSYIDIPHKETFKNEDEQIARMGEAAKDVFDRYDKNIPYSKLADGARYNKELDISGKNPMEMSKLLEFEDFHPSEMAHSHSLNDEELRYYNENRKINDEIENNDFSRIPRTLWNYHIRNFIINIRAMSMNVMLKNNEIPQRFKNESANFGKAFFSEIEHNYQDGARKSICRS